MADDDRSGGVRPRLTLQDWATCDPVTQARVRSWSDHSRVPAYASQAMMAIAVVRTLRKVAWPEGYLDVHSWVVHDGDRPVAFLFAELLSKWCPPEEFFPAVPEVDVPGPVMSFTTLVDPELWGRGYAAAAKMVACDHPAAGRAVSFYVCIRVDNGRSLNAISKIPGVVLIGTGVEDGYQWRHFRWNRPRSTNVARHEERLRQVVEGEKASRRIRREPDGLQR